ncbi:uncharacterized protein N7496_003203 [Penicillium cataractarum]|uniref:Uncharacterized protein n=1 Tax=Penicillium cataractarum TaxID=2100454 RepID=A0A9W9SMM4_9EURO|nr:uncharacterized protein N7496_003203 [Penicillium cataractarum]KAJ5380775.1 hypothetical protein N7496_003203 [Penicillium cataractarum]
MSSLSSPVPVILCGRRAEIGRPVSELLVPEFEVIHFITTNEAALTDIPRLLKGEKPQSPDDSGVGTQNYSQVPRAVVFGRGYDISEVEQFKNASEGSNAEPVAWITGDPNKKPDPSAPPPGPGYAQFAAMQVKEKLSAWKEEGATNNGIILW